MAGSIELAGRYRTSHAALSGCKITNQESYNEVTVGHRAVVHGCRVGDGALIGIGAIVLDGADVGEDALVGAGALVTPGSKIGPGMLALGAPAREVRRLTSEEIALQRERTLAYVENARAHAASEAIR